MKKGLRSSPTKKADEVRQFLSTPVEGKILSVKPNEAERATWLSLNIFPLENDQGDAFAYVMA